MRMFIKILFNVAIILLALVIFKNSYETENIIIGAFEWLFSIFAFYLVLVDFKSMFSTEKVIELEISKEDQERIGEILEEVMRKKND